jgi:hypothetical protein
MSESGRETRDEQGRFLVGHTEPGPGRGSEYTPEMNDMVRKMALLGATDAEMADIIGVSVVTFNAWKQRYPAFLKSILAGKIVADADVADSLYKQATGHFITIEKQRKNKQTGEYEAVKVQQYIPGNPVSAQFWLKNRRKDDWRDKQELEHSGGVTMSHEERVAALK